MGQFQIYDILKKNKGKWMDSKTIASFLPQNLTSVATSLRKLTDSKIILRRKINPKVKHKIYEYKSKG